MFFLEVTLHTAIFYLYGKTQGRMKSDGELVFNWDEQNKGVIKDKLKQFPSQASITRHSDWRHLGELAR